MRPAGVIEVDAPRDPRWDAFVRAHPRATANHLSAWARILEAAYGFKPMYLALEDGSGSITGVMPQVYARGLLSGPRMSSLPALRWAGPLATTFEAEAELLTAACELVRSGKPRRLGTVTMVDGYEELVDGLGKAPTPPSWRLPLPSDPAQYMRSLKKRSKGHFYDVRKAAKAGVTVREAQASSDMRAFYRLYLRTMRAHRSLPRPYKKFSLANELLGSQMVRLFVAELDGRPIAGLLCHFFNGVVETMYNASHERSLPAHPNHALYAHAITTAIEEGLYQFDFGGAWPHESLASFKRRWGAEPVERFNYTYPSGGAASGGPAALARAQQRSDESGRAVSWAWNHVPLAVTRAAGEMAWRYV